MNYILHYILHYIMNPICRLPSAAHFDVRFC